MIKEFIRAVCETCHEPYNQRTAEITGYGHRGICGRCKILEEQNSKTNYAQHALAARERRDRFICAALTGILANHTLKYETTIDCAELAVNQADAVLVILNGENTQ